MNELAGRGIPVDTGATTVKEAAQSILAALHK